MRDKDSIFVLCNLYFGWEEIGSEYINKQYLGDGKCFEGNLIE